MIRWRQGTVASVGHAWAGARELTVSLPDDDNVSALAYPELVGEPEPGDRVVLNVGALELGLGTGGYAMVVAVPERLPADAEDGPGHLVKARYTPLQTTVLGVDEQDSPSHDILTDADDLDGLVVVTADLHSAVPAIIAGLRASEGADARVVYLMTDGGALPIWFSRTVAGLRDASWLAASVTVGQAFGGDAEAVTLHSGLLAARHVLGADVVVVSQGPGNLGTGTRWGFSGVACGEAINAVTVLGGRPVGSLRISKADARERHFGISHHSLTAYGKVALTSADIALPELPGDFGDKIRRQALVFGQHRVATVALDGLRPALEAVPVQLSSMGRGLDEDAEYFLAAAAAGRHAAALLRHDS